MDTDKLYREILYQYLLGKGKVEGIKEDIATLTLEEKLKEVDITDLESFKEQNNLLIKAYEIIKASQQIKDDSPQRFIDAYNRVNEKIHEIIDSLKEGGGKRKPLTACTVSELKAKAKKRGINVTGLKKAEIIAKLRRR